jgi:hypothetical protein
MTFVLEVAPVVVGTRGGMGIGLEMGRALKR